WNPIRVSINGPVLVSALVVAGNFLLQVWLFVPAWNVAGPVRAELERIPPPHLPGVLDALIIAGWPSAAVLLVLLALRVAPPIAVWERKLDVLLRHDERYLETEIPVIAKAS